MIHFYEDQRHLKVNPELRYSNLAVEFDKNKTAIGVLSHNFFNSKWLAGTDL